MENIEHLPASVRELIAIIGLNETLDIVRKFGGTTLPMPVGGNINGRHTLYRLSEVIGEDSVSKMSLHYSGEPVYIPRCEKALRISRNSEIDAKFIEFMRQGMTANAAVSHLAHQYKLSDRWIWQIIKKHCEPDSPEISVNVKPETLPIPKPIKEFNQQELNKYFGAHFTLKLINELGGYQVLEGSADLPEKVIDQKMGDGSAQKLYAYLGGKRALVPKCLAENIINVRQELIIEDYINLIESEVLPSVAIASLSDKYYLDRRSVKLLVGV